jgi:hypothetical protein
MSDSATIIALDSLFDAERRRRILAPRGSSIMDMMLASYPGVTASMRRLFVASINGIVVPQAMWPQIRPKPGTTVMLRPIPGDNVLRNVLTIAVTVAAIAAGQFYAPILGSSLGLASGGFSQSLLQAGISGSLLFAGTALINALVPLRKDKSSSPAYSIQGLQNQATPDGVVPSILGTHRIAPVYAGTPFTEAVAEDIFVTALFTAGYGPVIWRNLRIGETPIDKYKDVIVETRDGYEDDERITLYPRQVIQEALSMELKLAGPTGGPQSRFTPPDVTECSLDIAFPGGLGGAKKDGGKVSVTVEIRVRFRLVGNEAWDFTAVVPLSANAMSRPLTRTLPLGFPVRGRYEIELSRLTFDYDDSDQSSKSTQRVSRSVWAALRCFRPEYPINFAKPLALAAVRIRASAQLNGTLDQFNADVSRLCPDWDAPSGEWIVRETSNPASLFRHVLTGPEMAYPLTIDEVSDLADWHEFCVAKQLTYNRLHDSDASVLDVLSDIAAAGRASPHDTGEKWGVVVDRAIDAISAHVTPRNSWGFQGERPFAKFPDAFRVSFLDETNGYSRAERVVPWPGFEGVPRIMERLDLPGHTDPAMVYRETRRRQYEIEKRPHTYTTNQAFENFVLARGDRAQLSHDVLDRALVSGRVNAVVGDTIYLDEPVTFENGKTYAIRFRRGNGETLLRTIAGFGTTQVVMLTGDGDSPAEDELFMFGPSSRESFACTLKSAEAMENFNARLTFVDHAPEIEALVDAEIVPPWSGRSGALAQESIGLPLAPKITNVASGRDAASVATDLIPYPVIVSLIGDPLGTVAIVKYEVSHRLIGGAAYSVAIASAASGAVLLPGYSKGDDIEFRARGISSFGTPGDFTALMTHVVGSTDPIGPVAPDSLNAEAQAGGAKITWTSSTSANNAATQVYVATGTGAAFSTARPFGDPVASGPNVGLSITLSLTPGPYSIFVVALDNDSPPIASIPRGPVNVTVA